MAEAERTAGSGFDEVRADDQQSDRADEPSGILPRTDEVIE
jgi:hypothetical protein